MKSAAIALFLALTLPLCAATFNVRDFGATGDGQSFDTAAIQKALNACKGTDGTVEFPPGNYLSQPLVIGTKTTFQLDAGAVLWASTNQQDFMKIPGNWLKPKGGFISFLTGSDLADVTLTGPGMIDGNGYVWWGEAERARQIKPGYTLPRPNLINLNNCTNLRVLNLTLRNSPKFHLVPTDADGVLISNVTIIAPPHAANTDAIDPSNCRNVLITHCRIDTGDDNVAIKAGKKVPGQDYACENITVTDCTFLHGHGMSIGSETAGGVHHVVVRDCTFTDTENGLRIKSVPGKGGVVDDITYENITMTNVDPAITFICDYHFSSSGDTAQSAPAPETASTKIPAYRNIHISHLTATCPRAAGIILGLPDSEISDVTFDHVNITAAKSFSIHNAKGIQFNDSTVTVPSGSPLALDNAEVSGLK